MPRERPRRAFAAILAAEQGYDARVMSQPPAASQRGRLLELAALFLRLGATSFGGPAAHVALMEDEVVRRRAWLTREELLDLYGAANLIPGPSSTELAIHIGHRRAGAAGLVVAGACFILPASLITLAVAWAYVRFGSLPAVGWLLYGVKPVILAVVVQALWGLARSALKTRLLVAIAAGSAIATAVGAHELAVLFGAGALVAAAHGVTKRSADGEAPPSGAGALLFPFGKTAAGGLAALAVPFTQAKLFLFFLKVGSVLFGSGYVLLAFLRADLVDRFRWMTEAELLDAVAVGQITPGPVFTTATFIGYVLGGGAGAALATAGIFLPAFFFVAVSGPLLPRIRRSKIAGAFLDGVNAASLALMAVVSAQLARAALFDVPTVLLALAALVLLLRYKTSSIWLVLGGAIAGGAVHLLR